MLNIHLLRRLTDQRLKALKRSIYAKRSPLICGCCGEVYGDDNKSEYLRHTRDLGTISRIQMERKNG